MSLGAFPVPSVVLNAPALSRICRPSLGPRSPAGLASLRTLHRECTSAASYLPSGFMNNPLSPRPGHATSRYPLQGWRSSDLAAPGAKALGPSCTSAPPVHTPLEVLRALPGAPRGQGWVRGFLDLVGPPYRSLSLGGRGCSQSGALLGLQTPRVELIVSGQ